MADKIISIKKIQADADAKILYLKQPLDNLGRTPNYCPPKITVAEYVWVDESDAGFAARTDNQLVTEIDTTSEANDWRGLDPICVVTDVTAELPTTPLLWLYHLDPQDEFIYAKWSESETDPLFPESFIDFYELEYNSYDNRNNPGISKRIYPVGLNTNIYEIPLACITHKARIRAHDSLNRFSGWSDVASVTTQPYYKFKVPEGISLTAYRDYTLNLQKNTLWYKGFLDNSTAVVDTTIYGEALHEDRRPKSVSTCWAKNGTLLVLGYTEFSKYWSATDPFSNGKDHAGVYIYDTSATPYNFDEATTTFITRKNLTSSGTNPHNFRSVYMSETGSHYYTIEEDHGGSLHTPSPRLVVYDNLGTGYDGYHVSDIKYFVGDFGDTPVDCYFSSDGLTFWIANRESVKLYKCSLTTAFKLSEGFTKTTYNMRTFSGLANPDKYKEIRGIHFAEGGHYLIITFSWEVPEKRGYQIAVFHMATAYDTDNMTVHYERVASFPPKDSDPDDIKFRRSYHRRYAFSKGAGDFCSDVISGDFKYGSAPVGVSGHSSAYVYPLFYKYKLI